jgi:hypothetical protein
MKLEIRQSDSKINESVILGYLILNNDIEPLLMFPIEEYDLNEIIIYLR